MNGKVGLGLGVVAGVAVIGGLLYLAFAPVETEDIDTGRERQHTKPQRSPAPGKNPIATNPSTPVKTNKARDGKRERKPRMQAPEDWFAKLPNAGDRAVAKRIQDAQDADDQAAVFKAAEEALGSKSSEVRSAAVEALSLQGESAMPLLLKFVSDTDKDVADSAYRAWDDAVDGVDGDLNKLAAVKQALAAVKDREHVKSAVGKIEMFDQSRAIRELAKLARDGGKAAEAAKESYESVTGEPFESWAAAELKAIAIDRDNANSGDE